MGRDHSTGERIRGHGVVTRLHLTKRCLREDAEILDVSVSVPADDLTDRHEVIRAFVERRRESTEGRETTRLGTATAWNLHVGRFRGLTYDDNAAGIVWLLGFGYHRSGDRSDAYQVLRRIDAAGGLLPTAADRDAVLNPPLASSAAWPAHSVGRVREALETARTVGWRFKNGADTVFGSLICYAPNDDDRCTVLIPQLTSGEGADLERLINQRVMACPHERPPAPDQATLATEQRQRQLMFWSKYLVDAIADLEAADQAEYEGIEALDDPGGEEGEARALELEQTAAEHREQGRRFARRAGAVDPDSIIELRAELKAHLDELDAINDGSDAEATATVEQFVRHIRTALGLCD